MRSGVESPLPATAAVKGGDVANSCFWRWDSPLPYLFGGLAAMLGLIAVALIILACSNRKSSSSAGDHGQRPVTTAVDMEPSVVVVMAGDDGPSFLAKAVPSARQTS
ncbi:hypothetical protein Taro_037112 [Colocasia esculenta]|uniref:Uncharacterized protein n=1 Tax=Colocasia esculenta TaxID=4460 RepID=A0A843WI90_COLES|nr:hypothetical protein [Colocasia esculenta]